MLAVLPRDVGRQMRWRSLYTTTIIITQEMQALKNYLWKDANDQKAGEQHPAESDIKDPDDDIKLWFYTNFWRIIISSLLLVICCISPQTVVIAPQLETLVNVINYFGPTVGTIVVSLMQVHAVKQLAWLVGLLL